MTIRFRERIRILLVAGTVLGAAAVGIACGGDDSSSGATPDAAVPTPPGTPPAPPTNPPVNPPPPPPPGGDGGPDSGPLPKAATPTCAPDTGTFTTPQNVALASATAGADIYFTTNGTNPTTGSTVYATPISVGATQTIRAMAGKAGFQNSDVKVCTYTINIAPGTTAPVTFSVPGAPYPNTQLIGLASATAGATICYTTDGSASGCAAATATCTGTSVTYNGATPVQLGPPGTTNPVTIKATACKVGNTNSVETNATYSFVAAVPTATPGDPAATTDLPSGANAIQLQTATAGGVIHYLIYTGAVGADPTCGTTSTGGTNITDVGFISAPITVNSTIKAVTCKGGYTTSAVQTFVYTVREATPTVTFAPAGTPPTFINDENITFAGGARRCYVRGPGAGPTCNAAGTGCATGTDDTVTPPTGAAGLVADNTEFRAVACSASGPGGHSQSALFDKTWNLKVDKVTIVVNAPANTPNAAGDTKQATFYDTTPGGVGQAINMTFSTGTTGAKIRYRLDGSAPTACGTAAVAADHESNSPVTDATTVTPETVQATACKAAYQPADAHTATIGDSAGQVQITVQAGTTPVNDAPATGADQFAINFGLQPADATVCYQLGAQALPAPDCNAAGACTVGTTYSAATPPTVSTDDTWITAIACKAGLQKSITKQFHMDLKATLPAATPAALEFGGGGPYPVGTIVTFSESTTASGFPSANATTVPATATPGVTFHYNVTTDGSVPAVPTCATGTVGSTFTLAQQPTTFNVVACKANFLVSQNQVFTYFVAGLAPPTFTPGGPPGNGAFNLFRIPEVPQTVQVSTVSSAVPGAVICYNKANDFPFFFSITPVQCNAAGNGCTQGTAVPASTGVSTVVDSAASVEVLLHAVTCAPGFAQSAETAYAYVAEPSAAVLTTPAGPYAAPLSVNMSLAPPPTGALQTTGVTYCYTTDGTAPTVPVDAFGRATACTSSNNSTTCTTAQTVNVNIDETTGFRVRTCKANYFYDTTAIGFPDPTSNATYVFNEYTRGMATFAGFLDAENLIATSDAGYGFYVSWDHPPSVNAACASGPGCIYLGLKGADLGVDNTSHINNFFLLNQGATATKVNDSANNGGVATALPTFASDHWACINGATADTVTCNHYQWTGTQWLAVGGAYHTETRSTANHTLLLTLARNGYNLAHSGTGVDRLITFGTINVAGTDLVSFPGAAPAYSHWIDAAMNSYHNPNLPAFLH